MAKINLLPWREERRAELQKEFLAVLGVVAVVAAGIVFAANTYMTGVIESQQQRNAYLQKNIAELNKQVKEIKELENKKQELLDRMTVIQELQGNRPVIVRLFDEMVRTIPDGVFYNQLTRKDNKIDLTGIAESNNRISSLMRRLNSSAWFAKPNLTSVTANSDFGEQASDFKLSFVVSTPSAAEKEGAK
jgi:type IV pilus assembly protein PilN